MHLVYMQYTFAGQKLAGLWYHDECIIIIKKSIFDIKILVVTLKTHGRVLEQYVIVRYSLSIVAYIRGSQTI